MLALLTVTVAAAIGFATAAYNAAPATGDAEFGSANHFYRGRGRRSRRAATALAAGSGAVRHRST